jgi:hypothetical protein
MGECTTTKRTSTTTSTTTTTKMSYGNWAYGGWSTCSNECGEGVERRLVVCQNQYGIQMDESKCDLTNKPIDSQKCFGQSCVKWLTSAWSNVS